MFHMIEPRCLIAADARLPLFPECFAVGPKWFHGRLGESPPCAGADRCVPLRGPLVRRIALCWISGNADLHAAAILNYESSGSRGSVQCFKL